MSIIKKFMVKNDIFNTRPRFIGVPADYKTVKPALIVFGAGRGEYPANPTIDTLGLLDANGSPVKLWKDNLLTQITDPVTGLKMTVAVLALQGKDGLAPNTWEILAATRDVISNYNIDTRVVIITGLSAGGQLVLDVLGDDADHIFTAGIEMSCPGTATKSWTGLTAKLLAFHGTQDTGITDYKNSVYAVNSINAANPGSAFLISVPTGHGPWAQLYDPAAKFAIPFGHPQTMNIYEWAMCASLNHDYLFTDTGTGQPAPIIAPSSPVVTVLPKPVTIQAVTTAVPEVTVKNGIATLKSSDSIINGKQGVNESFVWTISPAPAGWKGADGGADFADRTASGLQPNFGYVFSLTVYDHYGAKDTKTLTISTDAIGNYPAAAVVVKPTSAVAKTDPTLVKTLSLQVFSDYTVKILP